MKLILNKFIELNFYIFLGLIYILPDFFRKFLARLLGLFIYYIVPIRKKRVLINMRHSLNRTQKEHKRLAKKCYIHLAESLFEYSLFPFIGVKKLQSNFKSTGMEELKKASESNVPTFVATGHVGNGDLGVIYAGSLGIPLMVISKEAKQGVINKIWYKIRSKFNVEVVSVWNNHFKIIKGVKANKIIVFTMDQFANKSKAETCTFFGMNAQTLKGLALMAKKVKGQIYYAETFRHADHHTLDSFKLISQEEVQNLEIKEITQKVNDVIQKSILKKPEQWFWLHKRWKRYIS